jgi:transposase
MEKDYLELLVQKGFSTRMIVKETGKGHGTVRYWLKKYSLYTTAKGFTKTWADEDLIHAASTYDCLSDVMRYIGLKSTGTGNYHTLRQHAKRLGIKLPLGNKVPISKKRTDTEIFVPQSATSRKSIKKALFKKGRGSNCEICNIPNSWNGNKLTFVLDHINGTFNDNTISNLRLICPNCNSQLPTHCRKQLTL